MGNGPGRKPRVSLVKRSERAEAAGTPKLVTDGLPTSARCRATHDVPYTLRCVLSGLHPTKRNDDGLVVVAHKDKQGVWWEETTTDTQSL